MGLKPSAPTVRAIHRRHYRQPASAAREKGGLHVPVRWVNVQAVRLPGPAHRAAAGPALPALGERGHGSWYLAVELPAAPDGRRRRARLGGYATRAAAQAALGLLGTPGGPPRRGAAGCTTGQWLAAWLAGRRSLRP